MVIKRIIIWIAICLAIFSLPHFVETLLALYENSPPKLSDMPTESELTAILRHFHITRNAAKIIAATAKTCYFLLHVAAVAFAADIFLSMRKKRRQDD